MPEPAWLRANRANWDERVGVHLGPGGYDLSDLRAGHGTLNTIEEAELPPVSGKRVLHLQCHFGADTLTLAQCGAKVVGLDFSIRAIEAACSLANELGLTGRAAFVHADAYDALDAIPPPHGFDLVFATWAPFAGCRTSLDGRRSSRRCCGPADRCTSPTATPPPTCSMTTTARPTGFQAYSRRIFRDCRSSTRTRPIISIPTLGSRTQPPTTGSIPSATSLPA